MKSNIFLHLSNKCSLMYFMIKVSRDIRLFDVLLHVLLFQSIDEHP